MWPSGTACPGSPGLPSGLTRPGWQTVAGGQALASRGLGELPPTSPPSPSRLLLSHRRLQGAEDIHSSRITWRPPSLCWDPGLPESVCRGKWGAVLGLLRCSLGKLGPPPPVSLQSSLRSTCRLPWPSADAEKPQVWAAAEAQPTPLPSLSEGRNEFLPAAAITLQHPRRTSEVSPQLAGFSPTGREEPRLPHQELQLDDIEPSAAGRHQGPSGDKGEWEGERSGRAHSSHQWGRMGL